jgi:DNA-binding MarR family transcriptional regulator
VVVSGVTVRWLTPAQAAAWRAFLAATLLLDAELDTQLRRDSGMSHDYYGMLVQLSEADGRALRMSDLAVRSASSSSRISHAVAAMEKLGWVRRERARTGDKRVQLAVLTDAGMAALEAAAPGHVECVQSSLFDGLTDEQVDQLRAISQTVVDRLHRGVPPYSLRPG